MNTNTTFHSPFALKTIQDTGIFKGYASMYNIRDSHKDIVKPGAFDRALQESNTQGRWPKMLWQHDPAQPIGVWTRMQSDAQGLLVEGRLFLNLQKGHEAYTLLKEGVVDGLSIGYEATKARRQGQHRILEDITLHEISLVTFPSNESARILHVKKDQDPDSYPDPWIHVREAIGEVMGVLR
jgi:uncharacterized protein